MPTRPQVGSPIAHVITDNDGKVAVNPATTTPSTGSDYGVPVYANLGASPIAVDQIVTGAALLAVGQASISTVAQLVAARATRRSLLVTNTDATIAIYVGNAGVATNTGQIIKAGNSLTIPTTGAVYAVAGSGTVSVTYIEVYD